MAPTATDFIVWPHAELMATNDVPELGEFYAAGSHERLSALKAVPTRNLKDGSAVRTSHRVRRLQLYEHSSTHIAEQKDTLDINASASLTLKGGAIKLGANFSFLTGDNETDDTVRICKVARIVTHRCTLSREDIVSAIAGSKLVPAASQTKEKLMEDVANFAATKYKATHVASEVTYGHYVTMVLTYTRKTTEKTFDMTAGGDGNIELGAFKGSLSGSVNVVKTSNLDEMNVAVDFTCSDPYQTFVLPAELTGSELYAQATESFNRAVRAMVDQAAQSAAAGTLEGTGTALSFTYTPLAYYLNAAAGALVTADALKEKIRQDAVAILKELNATLYKLRSLSANPSARFSPRLMRTIAEQLQEGRRLRVDMDTKLADAANDAMAGEFKNLEAFVAKYRGPVSTFARSFTAFPLLPERLAVVRKRAIEMYDNNVTFVGGVQQFAPLSNTTSALPAQVATVRQWDGFGRGKLFELQPASDNADATPSETPAASTVTVVPPMNPPPKGDTWKPVQEDANPAVVSDFALGDGCAQVNNVVALARSRLPARAAVVDALSFYDNNIVRDAKPKAAMQQGCQWFSKGLPLKGDAGKDYVAQHGTAKYVRAVTLELGPVVPERRDLVIPLPGPTAACLRVHRTAYPQNAAQRLVVARQHTTKSESGELAVQGDFVPVDYDADDDLVPLAAFSVRNDAPKGEPKENASIVEAALLAFFGAGQATPGVEPVKAMEAMKAADTAASTAEKENVAAKNNVKKKADVKGVADEVVTSVKDELKAATDSNASEEALKLLQTKLAEKQANAKSAEEAKIAADKNASEKATAATSAKALAEEAKIKALAASLTLKGGIIAEAAMAVPSRADERVVDVLVLAADGDKEVAKAPEGYYGVKLTTNDRVVLAFKLERVPRLPPGTPAQVPFLEDGVYVFGIAQTKDDTTTALAVTQRSDRLTLQARAPPVPSDTKSAAYDTVITPTKPWRVERIGFETYTISAVNRTGNGHVWTRSNEEEGGEIRLAARIDSAAQQLILRAVDGSATMFTMAFAPSEAQLAVFFSPGAASTSAATTTRELEAPVTAAGTSLVASAPGTEAQKFYVLPA